MPLNSNAARRLSQVEKDNIDCARDVNVEDDTSPETTALIDEIREQLPVVDGLTEIDIHLPVTTMGSSVLMEGRASGFGINNIYANGNTIEHSGTPVIIERGIINPEGFDFEVYANSVTVDESGVNVRVNIDGGGALTFPSTSNVQIYTNTQEISTYDTSSVILPARSLTTFRVQGTFATGSQQVTLNHLDQFYSTGGSGFSPSWVTPQPNGGWRGKRKPLLMGDWGKGNDVWRAWNRAFEVTLAPVFNLRGEESEDQKQLRAEKKALAEAAQAHAKELLFSLLSPEQIRQWKRNKRFYLYVGDNKYCIKAGRIGNVALVSGNNRILQTYCCHPVDNVPPEDCVVAQMLMLQHNEQEFLKMANVHYTRPGFKRAA